MAPYVIGIGVVGKPPVDHPYYKMIEENRMDMNKPVDLPPMLEREKKVKILVEAAGAALTPLNNDKEILAECGVVTVTQWDGRFPILLQEGTAQLRSFSDVPPSSMTFTLVPHIAASCINLFYHLQGPSLSLSTKEGIQSAIDAAIVLLKRKAKNVLVVESDLALPDSVRNKEHHNEDYAIAFLLSNEQITKPLGVIRDA